MGGPVTCGDVKIYNEKQFHTLHLSVAKEMDIRMEGQSAGLKKEERYAGRRYLHLTAQNGNPIPRVIGWQGKLDVRKLNRHDYRSLPAHLLLKMETGMDTIYPDILTDPVLMVSEEAMEVIRLYDRTMPFLPVVLSDNAGEQSVAYFCPVLEEEGEILYRVERPGGFEIRICEELAESLLERGAVGMELTRA